MTYVQTFFYCILCTCFCLIAFVYMKILGILQTENNLLRRQLNITLDQEDFACLVRGGVLKIAHFNNGRNHLVHITLSDIGFDQMEEKIELATMRKDIYKEHIKLIE